MSRAALPYSFHDAYIESVSVGPRREISFALDLGSAKISDERLPEAGVLRFGAIRNFEDICELCLRMEGSRIEQVSARERQPGEQFTRFVIEADPEARVEVDCQKASLAPEVAG